jgi:membrane protease YdiL (CAAX protease family)
MTATDAGSPWHSLLSTPDAWVLTGLLAIVMPFFGLRLYRSLTAGADPRPGAKSRLYALLIVVQWLLLGGLAIICRHHGITAAELGERLGNPVLTLGLSAGLLVLLGAMTAMNVRQLKAMNRETLEKSLRRLRRFLPASRRELLLFGAMALTAGICEELLYRGWLVAFLGALTGSIWLGVLIGGAIFGLGHSYQGPRGIVATGVLGLLFGAIFVGIGSLYPVQLIHFAINFANGIAGASAMRRLDSLPIESSA